MRETQWIEWTRTRLPPQEREKLLRQLTSEQRAHLLEHDYVGVEECGVLWNPPEGDLRRARFTHGTHFRTRRGEFYIDSEGSARELSNRRLDPHAPTVRPPSLPGATERTDHFAGSGGFDNAVTLPTPGSSGGVGGAPKTKNHLSGPRQAEATAGESKP